MKTVIAVKAIGRTPPGGSVRLPANQARALVAMGLAAYAPAPKAKVAAKAVKATGQYLRRDMVAGSPLVLGAAGSAVSTSFGPKQQGFMHSGSAIGGMLTGKSDDGKA